MSQETIEFHQVQMQFSQEEDRINVRLNTKDMKQFSIALSRRYVKMLWPLLIRVLSSDPNFAAYDPATKQAAMEFQHENVMAKADYQQPFIEEGLTYPWGKEPLLVTKAVIKTPANSPIVLGLYATNNIGFEFPGTHNFLHYMYKGLLDMVNKIEWDLNLKALEGKENQIPLDKSKLN